LREASRLVADRLQRPEFDLVYQSRSGPPTQPWLGPDVNDHLRDLAERGAGARPGLGPSNLLKCRNRRIFQQFGVPVRSPRANIPK